MKKLIGSLAVIMLLGAAGLPVRAQNPLEVAPDMYRLLHENERVRVLEVTFQPGQSIPPHSHPDHMAYAVEGGKLRLSKPDGSSSDVDLAAGQVLWIPAETHWAENIGDTVVRILVVELKEPAPAGGGES